MAIFARKPARDASAQVWAPTIDTVTARPVIFALASAPGLNDAQAGAAIAAFVRLSERPSTEQLLRLAANAGSSRDAVIRQALDRPWTWLAAVMRQAGSAGDHHLVLAAMFWACYWTSNLLPRNNTLGALEELGLSPIDTAIKKEILSLGKNSAEKLPEDFVVAGDETGQLLAGTLALAAPELLGL
jgi:hypothetical protein